MGATSRQQSRTTPQRPAPECAQCEALRLCWHCAYAPGMDPTLIAAAIGVGGTVIVGIAGFWANVRNTNKTAALTEQGQVTDRYTKAIDQLGSDKLDVRIGGIYALERIARDSPRDHPTVIEVLAAFVRDHSHEQWPEAAADQPGTDPPQRKTRPDMQAAVTVIGRRDRQQDRQNINLSGSDLTGASFEKADLNGVELTGANLTRAWLRGANVFEPLLTGANLTGAWLREAKLTFAHLYGANFTGANLTGADLSHADLGRADFTRANLTSVNLTEANLTLAKLIDADLDGIDQSKLRRRGRRKTSRRGPHPREPRHRGLHRREPHPRESHPRSPRRHAPHPREPHPREPHWHEPYRHRLHRREPHRCRLHGRLACRRGPHPRNPHRREPHQCTLAIARNSSGGLATQHRLGPPEPGQHRRRWHRNWLVTPGGLLALPTVRSG
jgi:Pentapeptide repeats (8 copies)